VRWTAVPGYKDEMWFLALKTLFRIKKKYFIDKETQKTKAVNKIIFNKISDFLLLMSKYIEFESVIKILIEIDKKSTFKYSKEWFKNLFVSKADQEFLYRSAKYLLNNESSAMIDLLMDNHQHGFKGSLYKP